jgi:hypothetical protein
VCVALVCGDSVITGAVCLDMLLKCLWLQLTEDIYQNLLRFQQDGAASGVT